MCIAAAAGAQLLCGAVAAAAGPADATDDVSAGELSSLKAELARQAGEIDSLRVLVHRMAAELGIDA